jgi:hypothetical protein
LEERFFAQLADEGDTVEDVHRKIDLLLHSNVYADCDPMMIIRCPKFLIMILLCRPRRLNNTPWPSKLLRQSYMRPINSCFFRVQPAPGKPLRSRF